MALGHLGNYGTVTDIDTPTTDKEVIFNLWFSISRQVLLKHLMPNFALARKTVSRASVTPPFGYTYAYEYPVDCLKVLGLGDIDEKGDFRFTVESSGTKTYIFTEDEWEDGLELRYIKDISDVARWSPEFKMLHAWYLAGCVVMPITQDLAKKKLIMAQMPAEVSAVSGLNAQENPPIRKSTSRFRAARYSTISRNAEKR